MVQYQSTQRPFCTLKYNARYIAAHRTARVICGLHSRRVLALAILTSILRTLTCSKRVVECKAKLQLTVVYPGPCGRARTFGARGCLRRLVRACGDRHARFLLPAGNGVISALRSPTPPAKSLNFAEGSLVLEFWKRPRNLLLGSFFNVQRNLQKEWFLAFLQLFVGL